MIIEALVNGYILFKNTALEMEDDRVLCIKYKGKKLQSQLKI